MAAARAAPVRAGRTAPATSATAAARPPTTATTPTTNRATRTWATAKPRATADPAAARPPGGNQPRHGGARQTRARQTAVGPRPATAPTSPPVRARGGPPPTLTDLILPLATLLGHAERPGEGHGLGTLDPALCRALAATATAQPAHHHLRHGHRRRRHRHRPRLRQVRPPGRLARPPDGPAPPLVALPARINLTIRPPACRNARQTGPARLPRGWRWAIVPSDIPRTGSARATSGTGTITHAPGTTSPADRSARPATRTGAALGR